MDETAETIRRSTKWLRSSEDPIATRIRELLRERGVDPNHTLCLECFSDDCQFEFGLLVTQDRRCFQFGFDYLNKAIQQGEFVEWVDLTNSFSETPYGDQFSTGLKMLE